MTYVTTVDGGTVLFCNVIVGTERCQTVEKFPTADHNEALRLAAEQGWSHNALHGLDNCGTHG